MRHGKPRADDARARRPFGASRCTHRCALQEKALDAGDVWAAGVVKRVSHGKPRADDTRAQRPFGASRCTHRCALQDKALDAGVVWAAGLVERLKLGKPHLVGAIMSEQNVDRGYYTGKPIRGHLVKFKWLLLVCICVGACIRVCACVCVGACVCLCTWTQSTDSLYPSSPAPLEST